MEDHDHKDPIILTSPGRMTRGLIIVGITLAVSAGILITFFDEMVANPPPVTQIQQPEPPGEEPPAEAGVVTIAILSGAAVQGSPDYDPDSASVPIDSEIVWDNQDTVPHTATSGTGPGEESGQLFDTSLINGGEKSDPITLEGVAEGDVIPYYCFVHPYMTSELTVTAAGSGDGGSGGAPTGPTINILAGSATQGSPDYDPDSLTVTKGDSVTVVNQDTTLHTVTSGTGPQGSGEFDTGFMEADATATIETTNLDPATYDYFCMVHPYMKGTLVVE
jgi:plastocyanin